MHLNLEITKQFEDDAGSLTVGGDLRVFVKPGRPASVVILYKAQLCTLHANSMCLAGDNDRNGVGVRVLHWC